MRAGIADYDMLIPPLCTQKAAFSQAFGQRALLTVDTEEEFDWNGEFHPFDYDLNHVRRLAKFQEFCENIGVVPVYLIDWPIANSQIAVEILGDAAKRGTAQIGIQLHPWVNPPHEEEVNAFTSYAGNLPPELMHEKFRRLRDVIHRNFDCAPQIYRAGRYGLGSHSARMLREAGIAIDSSVRSRYDYRKGHGPDYSAHPLWPYWVDEERSLLELPLTTVYWGTLRQLGGILYPWAERFPRLPGLLSRLGLLERIALTPEGISLEDALRGLDIAIDDGLPVLVLSFHSPSLVPGNTPYVNSEDDLDGFYDWLRGVYAYLDMRGVRPTTVSEIVDHVVV